MEHLKLIKKKYCIRPPRKPCVCLCAGQIQCCNGNTPGRSAQSWNSFVCLFEYIKIFSIQISWLFLHVMRTKPSVSKRRGSHRGKNVVCVFFFKFFFLCYEGMIAWLILEQHVLGMRAVGWKQTDLHVQPCDCWSQNARNGCPFSFHFISAVLLLSWLSFSFLFCHLSFFRAAVLNILLA